MTLNCNCSRSSKLNDHGANGSPLVVFYLTSVVFNIVSLAVFEIFDAEVQWSRSRTVQNHPRSNIMVPMHIPWVISYSTFIDPIIVSVIIFFKYLTCNFDDIKLTQTYPPSQQGLSGWCYGDPTCAIVLFGLTTTRLNKTTTTRSSIYFVIWQPASTYYNSGALIPECKMTCHSLKRIQADPL